MAEHYIGKNDNEDVVRLNSRDRKKLLESVSYKITDTMGIIADANLLMVVFILIKLTRIMTRIVMVWL